MSALDTVSLLMAARMLISEPEAWTTRTYARSAKNHICTVDSNKAVKWCAIGALRSLKRNAAFDATCALHDVVDITDIVSFNDDHTHAEVLALFDLAIECLSDTIIAGDDGNAP